MNKIRSRKLCSYPFDIQELSPSKYHSPGNYSTGSSGWLEQSQTVKPCGLNRKQMGKELLDPWDKRSHAGPVNICWHTWKPLADRRSHSCEAEVKHKGLSLSWKFGSLEHRVEINSIGWALCALQLSKATPSQAGIFLIKMHLLILSCVLVCVGGSVCVMPICAGLCTNV